MVCEVTQSQSIQILSLPPILGATVIMAVAAGGVDPAHSETLSPANATPEITLALTEPSSGEIPAEPTPEFVLAPTEKSLGQITAEPEPAIAQLPTDEPPAQSVPVFPSSSPPQPSPEVKETPETPEASTEDASESEASPPPQTSPSKAAPTGEPAVPQPPAAEEGVPSPAPGTEQTPNTPPGQPPTPAPTLPVPSGDIPSTQPGTTPPTTPSEQAPVTAPGETTAEPAAPEPEVLVSEVVVEGAEGDLAINAYEAISTRPGQTTTRSQIQSDINAVFGTGFFSNVRAEPTDTPLGVRVTFFVQPNPTLKTVQVTGNQVLTQEKVDEIFKPQYGRILNLRDLQAGVTRVNKYYQDQGYVLAQVVGVPQIDPNGTVTLQVAEGVVEEIDVRYITEEGEPKKGKTREFIITREMRTAPGTPLNRNKLQADLQRVFGLGLFEDVKVALEPGQDPRKVVVNLNVQERSTASFSAGAGFSSRSGFFGTGSFTENNLGGNNQKLNVQAQAGTREFLFDVGFTDPWIAGDPHHSSYSVNIFNRLTLPLVFDNGPTDINLPNGDTPRVNRLGMSAVYNRPFTTDLDKLGQAWTGSVGIQYQRISVRDSDFSISPVDQLGNPLSFSGSGEDDLFTVQLGLGRDLRDDPLEPTKGSALRFGVEQSIPVGSGSILMTRLRGSYSYFIPVKFTKFTKGPQTLAFNVQAGTILGDLPPYEAFSLGGSSSVRGYGEGDLGSGRSFMQATAEYRFPLINFLGGIGAVLFVDVGSNLGTQSNVPGQPGIVRDKPGIGFGYGIGVRVKTPIGPVRLDYGINDDGENRFHFGFGQRF